MKKLLPITSALAGIFVALPAAGLFAQSPSPAPSATPSVSVPAAPGGAGGAGGDQRRGRLREALAELTPQERQTLKAAHEKAMTDPAVKAAEAQRASDPQAFRRAMYEAMLRADPSVGPILKKMRENSPR